MRDDEGLRPFYSRLVRRLPWWLALLVGVVAVAAGATLTGKPFASLGVLVDLVAVCFVLVGLGELVAAGQSPAPRLALAGAVAWLVAGVVAAVWSGITIHALAILAGVGLLVGGVLRLVASVRGDTDHRLISGLSGASRAIFGGLALSWPDITVLVLALLVGPATMLFGFGEIADALRARHRGAASATGRGAPWPRWLRVVGAAAAFVVALGLLSVSAAVHRGSNGPDAFYLPPADVPSTPGALLRSEPFTRAVPKGARAWRILYTTTRDDRTPAVASAIVVAPTAPASRPRPVIAWAHGTTGYAPKCAPSLLKQPFSSGALPALDQIVAHGWVLVATDYVGLGTAGPHPYLIGRPEARSVLDSIRAARHMPELRLANQTVVWGHSQGGGAALWTGILAPTYAPDAHIAGVAALAPASELSPIFDELRDTPVGKIMGSYMLSAYSAVYPDVHFDDYIRPEARVLEHKTAERCLSGPEALVSVAEAVTKEPAFSQSPTTGALGKRLLANTPNGRIEAPLLIAQGLADALVLPSAQETYVRRLCGQGEQVDYRTYRGYDHVSVVLASASPLVPDLIAWTQDRIAGKPETPGCSTLGR